MQLQNKAYLNEICKYKLITHINDNKDSDLDLDSFRSCLNYAYSIDIHYNNYSAMHKLSCD